MSILVFGGSMLMMRWLLFRYFWGLRARLISAAFRPTGYPKGETTSSLIEYQSHHLPLLAIFEISKNNLKWPFFYYFVWLAPYTFWHCWYEEKHSKTTIRLNTTGIWGENLIWEVVRFCHSPTSKRFSRWESTTPGTSPAGELRWQTIPSYFILQPVNT